MDFPDNCFVTKVTEPVKFVDVRPVAGNDTPGQAELNSHSFDGLEILEDFISSPAHDDYLCRFISLCQRTSWGPLQVTRPMLDLIVSSHGIGPSFNELPSCFYTRNIEVEGSFCIPYTRSRAGDWTEISYTIRYPEFRESEDEDEDGEWVIRQSGVYQRFNTATFQSVFVLFNPNPRAAADQAIRRHLPHYHRDLSEKGPYWLHDVLFSTYLPAWRQYIAAQEQEFLPIANGTFASFINEPLRLGYDNLSTLVSLESRFLRITTLIAAMKDVLDQFSTLHSLVKAASTQPEENKLLPRLQNHVRQCDACTRTATYLQQRTRSTAELLANTLELRDQVLSKEQNASMLQLNKSAVFITTLSLVYLPPSFVATFFGMNFFGMDQTENRIVATSMIWIYVVVSVILIGITFTFYYGLLQDHDSSVFRRLAPKARITADWTPLQGLKRRLSTRIGYPMGNPPPPGVELTSLSV